jgi:hypothetical protein
MEHLICFVVYQILVSIEVGEDHDAFRRLQRFINIRFRRYLNHRCKGRGFGWNRHPNSKLYAMGMVYIGSGMLEYPRKLVHGLQ